MCCDRLVEQYYLGDDELLDVAMTEADLEAALKVAFNQCEAAGISLNAKQKAILLQVLAQVVQNSKAEMVAEQSVVGATLDGDCLPNPLDELTQTERQTLLQFIQEQNTQEQSWKVRLLNDWLEGQDSGNVQFVREQYGLQWLERVQPVHIAQFADEIDLTLSVGDRIEISNSLWEWVQDEGPCYREWYPCTVVAIAETSPDSAEADQDEAGEDGSDRPSINCTVRFENGMEYEIQEVYGWNQYQWRWAK